MPAQNLPSSSRLSTPFFSTHTPTTHPQRCEYTSKRCENVRALKPNGERHRLCDYHRRLANDNQRRWQNRKKMQQRAEQTQVAALLELRHAASHDTPSDCTSEDKAFDNQTVSESHSRNDRYPIVPALDPLARPAQVPEQPCMLPRLRQHHVLSHALSLPASPGQTSPNALEFGGVPRANTQGIVPPLRTTHAQHEYERSTSTPVYFNA